MFPLGTVLVPGGKLPLRIFEPRYRQMVADCLDGDLGFGVVLISRGSEVGGGDQRFGIGTEAHIEGAASMPDGRWVLLASGVRRITIESWLPEAPYPVALVRTRASAGTHPSEEDVNAAAGAVRRAAAFHSELGRPAAVADQRGTEEEEEDPEGAIWRLCETAPLGPMDRQRLLETDHVGERVSLLAQLATEVADDLHRLLSEGGNP
jgi:Lon protease-like protein